MQPICTVNANLTLVEKKAIQKLQITKNVTELEYRGPVCMSLLSLVQKYIATLGENPKELSLIIAGVVTRLAQQITKKFAEEYVLLIIRATQPHNASNIPRWHMDGHFFIAERSVYKSVFTVKGPMTRFAEVSDQNTFDHLIKAGERNTIQNEINSNAYKREDMRIRVGLMTAVREIFPAGQEEIVAFLVENDDAVVHSEPILSEP